MKFKNKFLVVTIIIVMMLFIISIFCPVFAGKEEAEAINELMYDSLHNIGFSDSVASWGSTKIFVTIVRIFQVIMSGLALGVLAYTGIRILILSQQKEVSNERILLRNAILVNVIVFGADVIITTIILLFS